MAKAKKTKKVERKTYKIEVDVDTSTWTTREGDDKPYSDRGETSSSHDIRGLKLLDDGRYGYRSAEVLFKPEKGQVYHLLYATYSTGDSFGYDHNHCFEVIGIYKDRKVAEENCKRLYEGKPVKKGEWGSQLIPLKVEGMRETHDYYRPWMGYFESLVDLEVRSLILN